MDSQITVLIFLLIMPLHATAQTTGCSSSEFPLLMDSLTACTANACPGHCEGPVCCVEQCFNTEEDALQISSECNQGGESTCSGFAAEMQCVADLFNSSAEICEEQVMLLYTSREITGDFHPWHCPCENGYVKVFGNLSAVPGLCEQDGACYDVISDVTNDTVHCVSPTLVADGSSCADREKLDKTDLYVTNDECDFHCGGTCRDGGTGKLPACCKLPNAHAPTSPEQDGGGDDLHVGFIILIVVVVVILLVTALFGWLYMSRYRQLQQQQKMREEFTDITAGEVNTSAF